MNDNDPWLALRTDDFKDGLRHLQDNYDKEPTAAHIIELGVAYMWLEQYEKAREHFIKSIKQFPMSISSFYGMAGAANWCLGESNAAVEVWQNGLNTEFTDTNGLGIHLPLLLYVASVLRPNTFDKCSAIALLKEKANDQRIKDWPGPIARFLIGELTETGVMGESNCNDLAERQDMQWLSCFYCGLHEFGNGSIDALTRSMEQLTDTSLPDWSDPNFFLARMWNEEFFIARNEVSKH